MRLDPTPISRTGAALCLALICMPAAPRSLLAQCLHDASRFAHGQNQSEGDEVFTLSELGYASGIVLSLFKVEALQNFDAWASHGLSRDSGNGNTGLRWGGRELGNKHVTLALAAGPLVYGLALGDREARRLGLHSLESVYAAAFLTRLLKTVVGRARPSESSEPDVHEPFSADGGFHSFPSGHTSRVFALAATFAHELGDSAPWVPYVAYSLAAWTATTRVMDRAHWLTDTTGGALLGILTSRLVERLNHRGPQDSGARLDIFPFPDGGVALGVSISSRHPPMVTCEHGSSGGPSVRTFGAPQPVRGRGPAQRDMKREGSPDDANHVSRPLWP